MYTTCHIVRKYLPNLLLFFSFSLHTIPVCTGAYAARGRGGGGAIRGFKHPHWENTTIFSLVACQGSWWCTRTYPYLSRIWKIYFSFPFFEGGKKGCMTQSVDIEIGSRCETSGLFLSGCLFDRQTGIQCTITQDRLISTILPRIVIIMQ